MSLPGDLEKALKDIKGKLDTIASVLPSGQAYSVSDVATAAEKSISVPPPGARVLVIRNKGDVDVQVGLNAPAPAANPLVVRARTARTIIHSGVTAIYFKTAAGSSKLEVDYFS